jgi:hypothetical protein
MSLKNIIFTPTPVKEIEYLGHKIVIKALTLRDTLEMNLDFKAMSSTAEDADLKSMLSNTIELLCSVIVSVDGEKPDNREDTREFLLAQGQKDIMELFKLANVFDGDQKETIKN